MLNSRKIFTDKDKLEVPNSPKLMQSLVISLSLVVVVSIINSDEQRAWFLFFLPGLGGGRGSGISELLHAIIQTIVNSDNNNNYEGNIKKKWFQYINSTVAFVIDNILT